MSDTLRLAETEMHYGEALAWIESLHAWIERQGLEVPSWATVGHLSMHIGFLKHTKCIHHLADES